MAKRKAIFMVCLLTVAFGLTALVAVFAEKREQSDGLLCVTSFYPVQLLAESVTEGAEGVTVRNLTENHSGCIHDYTLTTQDMRLLSEAELFLINGGEMELFLEKAASEYKDLEIVDTSAGYAFLEGVEHNHDHGTEVHDQEGHDAQFAEFCTDPTHAHEAERHEDEEACTDPAHNHGEDEHEKDFHEGHSHSVNAHIWMDIDGYLLQLSRVEEAFVKADPAQEELYRKNAEVCRTELANLKAEYEWAREALTGKETVVFHEGFVYLLRMLGIETIHCLAMDSDTQIAAGEAAEITEECRLHGITTLFAEADFAQTVTDTFGKELSGEVIVLDPVTGQAKAEGVVAGRNEAKLTGETDGVVDGTGKKATGVFLYCESMRRNLESIKQAYGVR